jgi:NAD(P)H-dependent FMN reductase
MATQSPIKLLGISGSLRALSYNSGALRTILMILPDGMKFEVAELTRIPFYNTDVEQTGFPDAVKEFRARVAGAEALIFAVSEYNFSLSGVLKNALEWLSRPPDPPVNGKTVRSIRRVGEPARYGTWTVPFSSCVRFTQHDSCEPGARRHCECQVEI